MPSSHPEIRPWNHFIVDYHLENSDGNGLDPGSDTDVRYMAWKTEVNTRSKDMKAKRRSEQKEAKAARKVERAQRRERKAERRMRREERAQRRENKRKRKAEREKRALKENGKTNDRARHDMVGINDAHSDEQALITPFPMGASDMVLNNAENISSPALANPTQTDCHEKEPESTIGIGQDESLEADDLEIDHSKLCPFCDKPLPPGLSAKFMELLSNAKARARPDPREWNEYGLYAALPEYVNICRQHELEEMVLPEGRAEGWPTQVDWNVFESRVMERKELLRPMVKGVVGEKEKSPFWRALNDRIKEHGSRKAFDAKRESLSFGGHQAGYYGEQGQKLIMLVLLKLFPPKEWNRESILPLTPMQATELILIPETTVSIIAEDIDGTFDDALNVMRQSSQYGALLFPSRDDSAADELGEHLVHERAMIRGREVEIEDQVEARVLKAEGLWEYEKNEMEMHESRVGDHGGNTIVPMATSRPKPRPLRRPMEC